MGRKESNQTNKTAAQVKINGNGRGMSFQFFFGKSAYENFDINVFKFY